MATAGTTLDEPISHTILRDLRAVGAKFRIVMIGRGGADVLAELRQWDLWGPLIVCLVLCIALAVPAPADQKDCLPEM